MSFVTSAFVLAAFCLVFSIFFAWLSYQQPRKSENKAGVAKTLLAVFGVSFLFLSIFSVLVGTGFAIELTNQAPCENVVNSSVYDGNSTAYTYVDSCADRATPESIERLYQAYAIILLAIILFTVFALMFLGLRAVVFKW